MDGLLNDRLEKGKIRLLDALEDIKMLCEVVAEPKNTQDYIRYFCGNPAKKEELEATKKQRHLLYKYTTALIRAYMNLVNELEEAGFDSVERNTLDKEVKHFEKVRTEIKIASSDYIDLKLYEPAMRHLLDTYIRAEESEIVSQFEDHTLVDLIVNQGIGEATKSLPKGIRNSQTSMAETIENNMRSVIIEESAANPKYYENMSILLDDLMEKRRSKAIEYEDYLQKMADLANKVKKPETSATYPPSLDSKALRALYDNLDNNEELALIIDKTVHDTKRDNWRGTNLKKKEVKLAIKKVLPDTNQLDKVYNLVLKQTDY